MGKAKVFDLLKPLVNLPAVGYEILREFGHYLLKQQQGNIDSHEQNAQNNGGVKQPFFKAAAGLHYVAGAAENIGQPGRLVLQGNDNNQNCHDQDIKKNENWVFHRMGKDVKNVLIIIQKIINIRRQFIRFFNYFFN